MGDPVEDIDWGQRITDFSLAVFNGESAVSAAERLGFAPHVIDRLRRDEQGHAGYDGEDDDG